MDHPRVALVALALVTFAMLPNHRVRHAASFDCAQANTAVEKLICQDAEVSTLDEHLHRYYRAARVALGRGSECLQTQQRHWLEQVRNVCADQQCLRRVYLARLAELDGLQPGATEIREIELPLAAQLVGVLAPAEDEVAAPPSSDSQPVEIRGRIVDDVEAGDGFELQDERGERYLLRPLMFLEPEDATLLASAAQQQTTYVVRGFLDKGEAPFAFDVSRCAYIFRLPDAR